MIPKIGLGIAVVAMLISLLVISQLRNAPPFVSGIVETDEIRLGSRVGGRIKRVFVREGDHVASNEPLIEFEPYDLLERERQSIAELAVREAELKRVQSGLRVEEIGQAHSRVKRLLAQLELLELGPRQEEIAAAEERLIAAKAEQLLARREYDRRAILVQSNSVSRGELDAAKENFDAAAANMGVKKNELAILQAGARKQEIDQAQALVEEAQLAWVLAKKGSRPEEIEQAQAARDAAAAAVEVIRQQKTELVVVSPIEGFVDALDLQAGDLVSPNAPVMTVLSDNNFWVRAYVPQRFLRLSVGRQLRITMDSFPSHDLRGVVTFISQQAEFIPSNVQTVEDRAKQVYRIRVTIGGTEEFPLARIRAGMTANVWLTPVDGGD